MAIIKRRRLPAGGTTASELPFGEPVQTIGYDGIEQLPLDDLKPFPGNPRIHDEHQIQTLARMIQASGIMTPLIVDGDNRILAGEARLTAARLLGMRTVPVVRALARSEAEMLLYRLADNRAVELGRWDERLLAISIKGLADLKPNFNIEATGWKQAEIDIKFQSLAEPAPDETVDDIPSPALQPVSQLGDLWRCGPHRLLCGSALSEADFVLLMNGELARMAIQDPPYNVSVTKHVGGVGAIKHREFAMATGEMSREQFLNFLTVQLRINAAACAPGATLMSFIDWRSIDQLIAAGRANDLELINIYVWVKTNGSLGSLYRSKHEMICVFRKSGGTPINNVQLGRFGRYRTNVWEAPGANTFSANRLEELGAHPTPKNVDMIMDAIRDVSNRGDIVLDSFLGSGTTLIAAERTGRIAYGLELDPIYVDVTVRRWQKLTGQKAVLDGSSRTFDEIAVMREAVS